MTNRTWGTLYVLRVLEAAFALLALFFWLGLPFPPQAATAVTSAYLAVSCVVAIWLVVRLDTPTRNAWYAGAILSAVVSLNFLIGLPRLIGLANGGAERPVVGMALTLGIIFNCLQIAAGVCLWQLRHLRAEIPPAPDGAPAT
jgi:hypothetical protein